MRQEQALALLKTGKNVFLTGAAGAGKTYVLNQYIAYAREHEIGVGVTASTGIAATHINGMTIHAWSGIGIKDDLTQKDIDVLLSRQQLKKRMRNTQILIIDEVSMLAAHVIDMVDRVCRAFKESDKPFGGMQVIFCGDFFQLPPVATRRPKEGEDFSYDDPFFAAESEAWKNADVHVCYLSTQHRHDDDALTDILNALREGAVNEDLYRILRQRIGAPLDGATVPTRLYTHNIDVDRLNNEYLQTLETEGRRYIMTQEGKENLVHTLRRSCLAPEELVVRVGAVVMFVKNNFDAGYANGTLGTVIAFTEKGLPIVKAYSGDEIVAEPVTWSIEDDGVPLASVRQIPLRLAWAITVHKSQGMTLDAAVVDLSKSFVSGMGYVALSRVRSLKTLSLIGLNDTALMIDERVRELDAAMRGRAEETEAWLYEQEENGTLTDAQQAFLMRVCALRKKSTCDITRELVMQKVAVEEIAAHRGMTVETIISHIEKIRDKEPTLDLSYIAESIDEGVLREITDAFTARATTKLSPVYRAMRGKYTYTQLRLVRLCIEDKMHER